MRFLAAVALSVAVAGAQAQANSKTVRFVQITDAHIFDDGWQQPVADAMRQAADDRDALTWAVGEINAQVARGERVDFVMYSGDLGLQNVDFAGSGCPVAETSLQPGLPPFELRGAVDEMAHVLEALAVTQVYFTPGNNDLTDEKVEDAARIDCLVTALQQRLATDNSKLHVTVLNPANGFVSGGVRFLALDTAMFKNHANYETFCAGTEMGQVARQQGCPQHQMRTLDAAIRSSREPVALFVHVPDLKDPFRKTPAWDLSDVLRQTWADDVCSAKVLGVFAGHFHDANRGLYGVPSRELATKGCVGEKTFVAPPLAAKNQTGKAEQARGLMTVEIDGANTVTVKVTWYPGLSSVSFKIQ